MRTQDLLLDAKQPLSPRVNSPLDGSVDQGGWVSREADMPQEEERGWIIHPL